MASPYAFQNHHQASSPANGAYTRYNPALYPGGLGGGGGGGGTGGVVSAPTAATTPATAVASYGPRRPSVSPSPMRGQADMGEGGEYNPQNYAPVAGNGGGYVPRPAAGGDAPPPPYSPPQPQSSRQHLNPRLQLSPPHQRQNSWQYSNGNTPISPAAHGHSPMITPSTASTQTFSPLFSHGPSAVSSANTTPQSPYAPLLQDQSGWNSPSPRRRNYSPPNASGTPQTYAPSGLQQATYPSPDAAVPPSPVVSPRSSSRGPNGIPPPPPGPPPMRRDTSPMPSPPARRTQSTSNAAAVMQMGMGSGLRSHSNSPHDRAQQHPPASTRADSLTRIPPPPPGPPPRDNSVPRGTMAPGAVRGDSRSRGSIPPPPPGPPPRNASVPRQGPTQVRSVSSPVPNRMQSRSPPQIGRLSAGNGNGSFEVTAATISPGATTTSTSPPQPPPKRKMEGEQAPYKKSSPGPRERDDEEEAVPRDENNNPWKQSMNPPISSPTSEVHGHGRRNSGPIAPRIDTSAAPLIDFERDSTPQSSSRGPQFFSQVRRKPLKFITPSPVTEEPPKQLPTPPPAGERDGRRTRPVSHLLHIPTPTDTRLQAPLLKDEEAMDSFYNSALERHRKMIRQEAAAQNDEKRVKLWMEFVVRECQLREEQYPEAVKKMKASIVAQLGTAFSVPERTQELSPISPVLRGGVDGDVEMGNSEEANRRKRPESQWWGQYIKNEARNNNHHSDEHNDPALEARIRDEESSRGRTSSRWWEASVEGSQSDYHAVRSDGMGEDEFGFGRGGHRYPRAARASLKEIAENVASTPRNHMFPSDYAGSSAYPPDRKYSRSRSRPAQSRTRSMPPRPVKTSLDIAPLLTLLPPFPREYPAVNNSHPQLAVFRNLVRTLNDLSSVNAVKRDFNAASTARKETLAMEAHKRRTQHSDYIQQLYASDSAASNGPSKRFSFGQVESLNSDFQAREDTITADSLRTEFDLFQTRVVDPTHTDLQERISAASAAYADLVREIKTSADSSHHGTTHQQEGNELPELLEKLTCLKWLFDVREQLHRELYDLLAERTRRYKEVVITPYFVTRQADKIREAEDYFNREEAARRTTADTESLERYAGFLDVVEHNCMKGVEAQISAFWEVAPLIMESLENIPLDLTNVHPIVPPEEFHENPAYLREPLRYLLAKIQQAERSVYQFVEGQTNLLCLLHEIKTLNVAAVLTEDLKEKVKMLESEWHESLGKQCEEIKERVGRFVGPEVVPTTPVV
ncbi:hypothetical protein P167DRAFT_123206 [Morchella conica CCBAS932]|uniref:Uncharacterized protein n=1 Tax=Morchella conica CCBAS932 TaxID=1392247 RepID=A0A3N4L305_9PEZI|nr:hypothetical protein P167DRAFT_123206 [Morchella conica CCBAS932]